MTHQEFRECIDACNACAAACDNCATACLAEEDVKMMARCIALDIDCAQICRLALICKHHNYGLHALRRSWHEALGDPDHTAS